MLDPVLVQCRSLLEEVTPLRRDCGALCGAACCSSLEGEETGMLLFPGEEEACGDEPGFRITEGAGGKLCICSGRCERSRRPLACRLFPALPVIRDGGIRVEMDLRARAVCPLARQRVDGLSADFTEAVRRVGELLLADPRQRETLLFLTEQQTEMRRLRRAFSPGSA